MKNLHNAIQPINNNVIYIYRHIDVAAHEGFLKIGQKTGLESKREIVQNEADNVQIEQLYQVRALDTNGNVFTDHDIHRELEKRGYEREKKHNTRTGRMSEWFKLSLDEAKAVIEDRIECRNAFAILRSQPTDFALRPNQQQAVNQTHDWWLHEQKREYLWNAKPRFGKTVTAYEFAQRIQAKRILVVTQRTAISDSWFKDYHDWVKSKTNYLFGSAKNNVNKTPDGNTIGRALTTDETKQALHSNEDVIYYISLADIKGTDENKAEFKLKNKWLFDTNWDLFIIDEAHEGISTNKFKSVFASLKTDFTLHLSGTPFKQIADNQFSQNIYNWTYSDEQEQKEKWDIVQGENPYVDMPTMNIFTYQMSDELKRVAATDDFSFDFAEFFRVSGGQFTHKDDILLFLDKLANVEDRPEDDADTQFYPFADKDTRDILRHTFWLLPMSGGVQIANLLKELLKEHPVFKEYQIISAVSSGDIDRQNDTALKEVSRRIGAEPWNTKTITLSCGQLTTGVTVREWTGVVMLNNLKSPAQYLQAAFRAQNPWKYKTDNQVFNKTDCYVFDFAPDRVLKLVAQYASSLDTSSATRETKIKKLLNFLPVIAHDETGVMKALDANEVMTLPLKLDVADVVNKGFMDNKLFAIGNIFSLPKEQREMANEILSELKAVKNKKLSRDEAEIHTQDIEYDDEGNLVVSQETIINTTNGLLKDRKYAVEGTDEANAVANAIARGEEPTTQVVSKDELQQTAREILEGEANRKKHDEQQEQRDHLRGFSRTIPMFLMAYGKADTTLANFDKFVSAEVFQELAGISIDQFRFLRDDCSLFNEEVFNASITEFLKRKEQLSRYYLDDSKEDIFAFIPPQSKDNNQIFTPRQTVIEMVDLLETNDPSIFRRSDSIFIDPHMKSGLFIAEVVKRLYAHSKVRDENERIKHILSHQVYGFAPTPILLKICQQTIAGFDYKLWGNFVHEPLDEGIMANSSALGDAIRNKWGSDMKFDVIIGNPPYQKNISTGDNKALAKQLFPAFIKDAINLNPKTVCFIVPSRWFAGDAQDGSFPQLRQFIKKENHIKTIVHYPSASTVFPGVTIKGGVNYFLWSNGYMGDVEFVEKNANQVIAATRPLFEDGLDVILASNRTVSILEKVINHKSHSFESMTALTKGRNAFGIVGKQSVVDKISKSKPFAGSCELRCKNNEIRYIDPSTVTKNPDIFNSHKVFISKSAGDPAKDRRVLGQPYYAAPYTACTDTFIPVGSFTNKAEAINLQHYMATKFFRFMVSILKVSHNVYQNVYQFTPTQDFSERWTDKKLYDKYHLTADEIDFIESSVSEIELKPHH